MNIKIDVREPIEWATKSKGYHNRKMIEACNKRSWLKCVEEIVLRLDSLGYKFVITYGKRYKGKIDEIDIYTDAPKEITGSGGQFINFYYMEKNSKKEEYHEI